MPLAMARRLFLDAKLRVGFQATLCDIDAVDSPTSAPQPAEGGDFRIDFRGGSRQAQAVLPELRVEEFNADRDGAVGPRR